MAGQVPRKDEFAADEAAVRTKTLVEYLKAGKLDKEIKVILVIGNAGSGKSSLIKLLTGLDVPIGHTLKQGSLQPNLLLTKLEGQLYIFIDTPGFGSTMSYKDVRTSIQKIVGYFTRSIGGIHGILYLQNIQQNRENPGMKDSLQFLDKLAKFEVRSNITFITTHWDLVMPKVKRQHEERERMLKEETWIKFASDGPGSLKYYRHGISCTEDTEDEQIRGRRRLLDLVWRHYDSTPPHRLVMPFSEWTMSEQAYALAGWTLYVDPRIIAWGALAAAGTLAASGTSASSDTLAAFDTSAASGTLVASNILAASETLAVLEALAASNFRCF